MMVHHRLGILKFLTPLVASAAIVLGWAARAVESTPAADIRVSPITEVDHNHGGDGMIWCRVSGDSVNIRVGPNTSNQPVTTLRSGEFIRAKAVQNHWLEMEWPRNVPAWVLKDNIQVSAADAKSGTVRSVRARIMSQGMSTAPEVAVLERGAKIAIVAEKGDWLQVQAPQAARAYISAKYVVVDVEPPAETVMLPPASKSAARQERSGETVELPATAKRSNEAAGETVVLPNARKDEIGEVVVLQQQAAWPRSGPLIEVADASKAIEIDGRTLRQTAAKKQAEQDELTRLATERKRVEEVEGTRKAAEARRVELEAQAAAAAERKRSLEAQIAKLANARKKAEADEHARQLAEKKRLEEAESARVAIEARRKQELDEQSRLASERKRLEDEEKERSVAESRKKVELETQTRAAAERKKALEDELATLNAAKKRAEDEEKARVAAESKRLQDAENARVAAEAKRVELEGQAQKAAEKKRALEAEINALAQAKTKAQLDAQARVAREKKLADEAESARKNAETKRKAELDELAKAEAAKKNLDATEAARVAADAKRRSELAEQELAARARKKALEDEIEHLAEAKRKAEVDAVARAAADKKRFDDAQAAHALEESKQKAEIAELTKLAAEKKHVAELEAARAAAARKLADEAEAALLIAQKKRTDEGQIVERKQNDESALRQADARKKADEDAVKRVAERKRAEDAELARIASEKKRLEAEAAKAAENKRSAEPSSPLPEPGADIAARPARPLTVKTDKPIMLEESDLATGQEPTESNYNADYVPLRIREMQKKYIMPEAPPRLIVAETIDDTPAVAPAAKHEPAPKVLAPVYLAPVKPAPIPAPAPVSKPAVVNPASAGESVDLRSQTIAPQKALPRGPAVIDLDESNFGSEVEGFKGTVLVDFGATWCMPCRRTAPIVDELAEEFRGRVKVAKIDVDRAPGLARRFGVSGIPCLILFRDGKSENRHVGEPGIDLLRRWMQEKVELGLTPGPVSAPRSKDTGMNVIPKEQRSLVSDVGVLQSISGVDIEGVKYVLLNSSNVVMRYIIEPSDVDMRPLVGKSIYITGSTVGRSLTNASVIQMKTASTYG